MAQDFAGAGSRPAFVVRAGAAPAYLVAGQVVSVIAGTAETDGAFGLVACQAPRDRFAIPLHRHEREHDTWFCTRGTLLVWGSGQGRALHAGDFAYVPPGEVHAYQCVGTNNAFFGLVAPGGWEGFFDAAGTPWREPGMPPAGSQPFDMARMIEAQKSYRIMRVDQPYPAVADGPDDALPGKPQTYFLKAGEGLRRTLGGALFTRLIGPDESSGLFCMHVAEAPRGAALPAYSFANAFTAVHLLSGHVGMALGGEAYTLHEGDTAGIPAGTAHAINVESPAARWLVCTSGGMTARLLDAAGEQADGHAFPLRPRPADLMRLREAGATLGIILAG